jgi:phage regulator Rha-like protein
MNELIYGELTMSSQEISEVVGSRHDSVKRTMETLKDKGLITFTQTVEKGLGRPVTLYHVNKRSSYIVVAQLSPEFTAALVDRWQELENVVAHSSAPALPQTYLEALEKLVESEREKQLATQEVDRLQGVCQTMAEQFKPGLTPPTFGRMLNGVNINQIHSLLVKRNLIRKTKYGYRSMPPYRDKYFAEKHGENESGRPTEVVTLTTKGAKKLYKMYLDGELVMKKEWDGKYSHVLFDLAGGAV